MMTCLSAMSTHLMAPNSTATMSLSPTKGTRRTRWTRTQLVTGTSPRRFAGRQPSLTPSSTMSKCLHHVPQARGHKLPEMDSSRDIKLTSQTGDPPLLLQSHDNLPQPCSSRSCANNHLVHRTETIRYQPLGLLSLHQNQDHLRSNTMLHTHVLRLRTAKVGRCQPFIFSLSFQWTREAQPNSREPPI